MYVYIEMTDPMTRFWKIQNNCTYIYIKTMCSFTRHTCVSKHKNDTCAHITHVGDNVVQVHKKIQSDTPR